MIDWLVKAVGDDFDLKAGDHIRRFEKLDASHKKLLKSSTKEIAQLKEDLSKA